MSSPPSPLCVTHDDLRGAAQFLAKGKEDSVQSFGVTRDNYLPRKALPEKKLENM